MIGLLGLFCVGWLGFFFVWFEMRHQRFIKTETGWVFPKSAMHLRIHQHLILFP